MNIKSSFLTALVSPPKLPSGRKPEEFLGRIYSMEEESPSPLFRVLSGGSVQASVPFSFDIRSMDCFLLLHTQKGCGKLTVKGQVSALAGSTLLLLDCRERFRMDIAIAPWEYQVLFITGSQLSWYYDLLPEQKAVIRPAPIYSEMDLCFQKLLTLCQNSSLSSKLTVSGLLNSMITGLIAEKLEDAHLPASIPGYLCEIRDLFDNSFQEDYSLDALEERFGVSKYRLCREFGRAFGMPPLQYLNRRRIEIARHLLLTSDKRIHVIGSMVGIDNTNHFISLFKKFTGCTPLEYRQRKQQ